MVLAAVAVPYVLIYPPWDNRWRVPLAYHQDVNFHAMLVKTMILEGGYKSTPSLGAPFGQQLHDFPLGADHLHLLMLKLLTFFSNDPYIVLNLYYALSFFLVALVAHIVFRSLGLRPLAAAAPAVLFAFLPYHFWHHSARVFLSAYYSVPLAALLAVWVATSGIPLSRSADPPSSPSARSIRTRWLAIVACVLIVGSSSAYYAVFAICIIGTIGMAEAVRRLSLRPFAGAVVVVAGICLVLLANLAPDLAWRLQRGTNPQVAQRSVAETEHYGLRLAQMILPSERERLSRVVTIGPSARATEPGEDDAYMGVLGVTGLALALGLTLAGALGDTKIRLPGAMRVLAVVPLVAILFGEVGGLSVVIATLGFTTIRSWSRIGLFVSFSALGTLAMVVQHRLVGLSRRAKPAAVVVVLCVSSAALIEQVPTVGIRPAYGAIAAAKESDQAFVRSLESALPTASMVFQLPVLPFPEGPHVHDLIDYDLLKGYISGSGRLRWSYGGMRGRESDWQIGWSLQPMSTMIRGVAAAGFSALYVDRAAYPDAGAAIDAQIRPVAGAPVSESNDGRLRWYDLRPVREELSRRLSDQELEALGAAVTRTPRLEVLEGVSGSEVGQDGHEVRSISGSAQIAVLRPSRSGPVTVSFKAYGPEGAALTVRTGTAAVTALLSSRGTPVDFPLALDGPRIVLHLTVEGLEVGETDMPVKLENLRVIDPVVTRTLPAG